MNARDHADEQWDANLRSMAETMDIPAAAPRELRERCVAVLKGDIKVKNHQRSWRTAVFSTVGIAAAIIVLFGFFGFPHGQTEVNAAVILRTLNEQVQASEGISITLDSIVLHGVSVDGRLQIAQEGMAGDIKVDVEAAADRPAISVDATIGMKPGSAWVLLRKLDIDDPKVRAIVWMFAPPGQDTLVVLPIDDADFDFSGEFGDLKNDEITAVIDALIEAQDEVGATIEPQPDGTILLTLPIQDAQTLEALSRLPVFGGNPSVVVGAGAGENKARGAFVDLDIKVKSGEEEAQVVHQHAHHRSESESNELVGATIKVLYNPAERAVRWFRIEDFGEANGTISISFDAGPMDASRLDKEGVMDEGVRVVDLAALKMMFNKNDDAEVEGEDSDD